jgi:hypothetical protein
MLLTQTVLEPVRKTYDAAGKMRLGMQQEELQQYVAFY